MEQKQIQKEKGRPPEKKDFFSLVRIVQTDIPGNKKIFESFEDLKKRVSNLPDPKKAIEKRLIEEISGKERYYLFIKR